MKTVLLDSAGETLRGGGLVAFPTETFFGLAAIPSNTEAVEELCALKGRASGAGVPLIASAPSAFEKLLDVEAAEVKKQREFLQSTYWPGPLTLIVSARAAKGLIHPDIFGPEESLAIRVSSRLESQQLAEAAGGLITSTSANPKARPPSSSAAMVHEYFADLTILEESSKFEPHTAPSTILDVRSAQLRVLREGAISGDEILRKVQASL